MKISELTITDYRAFKGEHIFVLSPQFTVIAGINGRGKTAVLDGLALLISRAFRNLGLTHGDQRTILANDVHGDQEAAALSMKANCAGVPLNFAVSFRPSHRRVMATRLSAAVKRAIVTAYGDPHRADDQAPIAVYYTTDRAGFRLPRRLPRQLPSARIAAYHGALVNRMVDYRDFMARYRVWLAEQQNRIVRAVERALGAFLEGFGELQVEESPLRVTVRKGAQRLVLGQLSDGERAFVAVVADLVRRLALANPELDDPLMGRGVVLIDELELHLHPQWQRTVVETLRSTFPHIQFVATTHSPFIIQSLRGGELINLDPEHFGREYADKSIEDIAESVQGVDLPQKSERYRQMVAAAEEFIRKSRRAKSQAQVAQLRAELDRLSEAYSDDPAYVALLRIEHETAGQGGRQ